MGAYRSGPLGVPVHCLCQVLRSTVMTSMHFRRGQGLAQAGPIMANSALDRKLRQEAATMSIVVVVSIGDKNDMKRLLKEFLRKIRHH